MNEPKTKWPIQLFNLISRNGAINSDRLIKAARRKTKLNNLGSDFDAEPLDVLCQSINKEAGLHPFGMFMMKQKLIGQLESRLWAEHWFEKHPEILEQPLLPVILITGLQRTGTTKLQRLLSDMPEVRGLKSWEGLYPAPVKESSETDVRIKKTKMNEKAVRWISPSFYSIHPVEHDNYEEDVLLLDLQFMSSSSEAIMNVPSYAAYLDGTDQTVAYQYEIKLLRLLQWQRGGTHWLIKSPHHLEFLDTLSELIPDIHLIWTHRDPKTTIPSYMSMLYHGRRMFSDQVSKPEIVDHWVTKIDRMLTKGLKDLSTIRNTKHLHFADLMDNQDATLEKICDWTGIQYQASIQVESNYKSRHTYDLKDWELTADDINKRFDYYIQAMNSFKE
ncbi:MAG: sulfotransferase [Bacteroidota bacterium]